MRFLAYMLWVFGIPIVLIFAEGGYWHWSGDLGVTLLVLFSDIILLAGPQFLWSLVCWAPIPRFVYLGGLIGAHAFLLWTAYSIRLDFMHHKYAHGTVLFLTELHYLPMSPMAVLVGALLGYICGKLLAAHKPA